MIFKKKNLFSRVKNEKEAVYEAPEAVKQHLGMYQISESGLVKTKNVYQKMYFLTSIRSKDIMLQGNEEIITGLDNNMETIATQQLIYNRARNQFLLTYETEYEDRNMAYEGFQEREKLLDVAVHKDGLNLKSLTANERLANIHDFFLSVNDNFQVKGNYLTTSTEWIPEIQIDKKDCTLKRMKIGGKYCCVMFIRRFSMKINENQEFIHLLFSIPEVEYIKLNWTYIPDKQIMDRIRSEYIGIESLLVKMRRTKPEFVTRWNAALAGETMDGGYAGCGFSFLLVTDTEKEMDSLIDNIQMQADSFHVEISTFTSKQKEALYSMVSGIQQVVNIRTITTENLQGIWQAFSVSNETNYCSNSNIEEMKQIFFSGE